jgi:hypothetical protein
MKYEITNQRKTVFPVGSIVEIEIGENIEIPCVTDGVKRDWVRRSDMVPVPSRAWLAVRAVFDLFYGKNSRSKKRYEVQNEQ